MILGFLPQHHDIWTKTRNHLVFCACETCRPDFVCPDTSAREREYSHPANEKHPPAARIPIHPIPYHPDAHGPAYAGLFSHAQKNTGKKNFVHI